MQPPLRWGSRLVIQGPLAGTQPPLGWAWPDRSPAPSIVMSRRVLCPRRWAMPAASQLLLPLCLGLLLAPRAPGCLDCFSTPQQRLRVCQIFLSHASSRHVACLGALRAAFQPHAQLVVGVAEMEKLKDVFSNVIFSLEQKGMSKVPYQVAVPDAVAQIQPELAQLKPAPACVPPCGYQKDAQVYKCTSCSLVDCQLPLDCPVEDVWKNEGERTALTCRVPFQTPPDVRRSWKFARDLRTQDLSLFRDLHMGAGSSVVLRPTWGSHRGTYACQLAQQDDVLARKYFYLNVTASSQEAETELQDMFHTILQSPAGHGDEGRLPGLSELLAEPDSLHKRNVVLLMVGLALSALLGTLLLGTSPARAMREEVETGARFLSRLANRHGRLDKGLVEQFGERLATILQERYCRHWYPENPAKGQAYRCIRINRRQRVDESLLRACAGCGLAYSELALPWELSLWIDPGEVCCRLGENSQYFTVSPWEGGGSKGTPEPETSDYHSESPSESSSEDEGSARPPPAPAPAPTRPALREPGKQAAELFYVPAPVWLPCTTQRLVSYIPTYQPLTFYYVSVGAKPSPAKRSNPDRLRRLTHRAAKA
ncbi:unnamed protein product [Eretmochelys imbricata]